VKVKFIKGNKSMINGMNHCIQKKTLLRRPKIINKIKYFFEILSINKYENKKANLLISKSY